MLDTVHFQPLISAQRSPKVKLEVAPLLKLFSGLSSTTLLSFMFLWKIPRFHILLTRICLTIERQWLRDYTHCVQDSEGFSSEVNKELGRPAKIGLYLEYVKFVIISRCTLKRILCMLNTLDTGSLRGLTLSCACTHGPSQSQLATTMMMFRCSWYTGCSPHSASMLNSLVIRYQTRSSMTLSGRPSFMEKTWDRRYDVYIMARPYII